MALFFLKAAVFNFAGLAIIPFMHVGVVVEHHWLTERQFVDAVAVGMITPGPAIVAMVAFVGYLVAGLGGAAAATFAVSAPIWVLNVAVGPIFLRYRSSPLLRGFVKGVTSASVGAIAGVAVVLGRGAITDFWTAVIFLLALGVLYSRRVKEPLIVLAAGVIGLLLSHR